MTIPYLNDAQLFHVSLTGQLQLSGDRLKGLDHFTDIVDQAHYSKVSFIELFWHIPWARHQGILVCYIGIHRIYIYVTERQSRTYADYKIMLKFIDNSNDLDSHNGNSNISPESLCNLSRHNKTTLYCHHLMFECIMLEYIFFSRY